MKKISRYLAIITFLTTSCFGSFSDGEIYFNNGEYEKAQQSQSCYNKI